MTKGTRRAAVALLAVLGLAAASCGGDDDAADSTDAATDAETSAPADATEPSAAATEPADAETTEPEDTAVDTTEAEGDTTTPAGPASGEPIKIMTIATLESPNFSVPQVQTAVEARVNAINEAGGVNGRPLEVEFCNDRFDPNEAAACARRAGEIGAVAVLAGTTPQAQAIFPVLAEAGIPWVGGSGTAGAIELQDPISYPIIGGSPAMLIGVGRALVEQGGPNVAVITTDNAASQAGSDAVSQGIEVAGGTAQVFPAPLDTVDFSGIVATALATQPDAVAITTPPEPAPKVVQSLRQAGYQGLIGSPSSLLPPASLEALGADAEGVILGYRMVPTTNTENETVAQFLEEIQAQQADVRIDELGLNAWTAVNFLADVAGELDTVDGASIMAYLDDLPAPIELGSVPPYGSGEAPEEFPRAVNFVAILGQIQDGQVVQSGDFFDPLAP